MTHRGSAQGPYSPTIESVNLQGVTVIVYQRSPSLVNMQKKEKRSKSKIKKERERGWWERRGSKKDVSYFT